VVLSVWWFGSEWNRGLGLGGALVVAGSVLYSVSPEPGKRPKANGMKEGMNGVHVRVKEKAEKAE